MPSVVVVDTPVNVVVAHVDDTVTVVDSPVEVVVTQQSDTDVAVAQPPSDVLVTQQPDTDLAVVQEPSLVVQISPKGPQGVPGPQNLFVQADDPVMTSPGLWIQTGIGPDGDMTFWVEDGE